MFNRFSQLNLIRIFFIIIFLPVIITLFVVLVISFNHSKSNFKNYNQELNEFIANEVENTIGFQELSFKNIDERLNQRLKEKSQMIIDLYSENSFNPETDNIYELQQRLGLKKGIEDIYVINTNGIIINTSFPNDLNLNLFNFGEAHKSFLKKVFYSRSFQTDEITMESNTKRLKKYTYQATPDRKYIIELGTYSTEAEETLKFIDNHLKGIESKYKTIHAVGLFLKADKAFSFSESKNSKDFNTNILEDCFEREENISIEMDTLNETYLYTYIFLKRENSKLYDKAVIGIITDLKYQQGYIRGEMYKYLIIFFAIGIILVLILQYTFKRFITKPIQNIIATHEILAQGRIPDESHYIFGSQVTKNEIIKLGNSLHKLIQSIKKTIDFARHIGNGNLNFTYTTEGETDELGNALIKMQTGLMNKEQEETSRQNLELERQWQMEGIARLNQIISKHNGSIKSLCDTVLVELLGFIKIQMAAVFLCDEERKSLKLIASFAYDRLKYLNKEIMMGEGLIGTAAIEKTPFLINEIPDDYIAVKSGILNVNPKHLYIIPIIYENECLGVAEFASLNPIDSRITQFLNKFMEVFGTEVMKTMIHEQTKGLKEQMESLIMENTNLKNENAFLKQQNKLSKN